MPHTLDLLLPWEFSPTVLFTATLSVALYLRGVTCTTLRGHYLQHLAYFAGVGVTYSALQTVLNYYASHMFFVLQLQHFLLHDLGPALLAAAAPGETLVCGLPRRLRARLQEALRALRTRAPIIRGTM